MKNHKLLILFAISLISFAARADKPVCHDTHGGYCQYSGKVSKIYVNSGNTILLYFDTYLPPTEGEVAGYTITNGSAAVVLINESPEFAKMFYSTALAAQASKRRITIQMRGVYGGYLKADRIWLAE